MQTQRINPELLSKPLAAYCQVVRKGCVVTTAGMIATDAAGQVVGEGDIQRQTRQTLENMKAALEAAVQATVADAQENVKTIQEKIKKAEEQGSAKAELKEKLEKKLGAAQAQLDAKMKRKREFKVSM